MIKIQLFSKTYFDAEQTVNWQNVFFYLIFFYFIEIIFELAWLWIWVPMYICRCFANILSFSYFHKYTIPYFQLFPLKSWCDAIYIRPLVWTTYTSMCGPSRCTSCPKGWPADNHYHITREGELGHVQYQLYIYEF